MESPNHSETAQYFNSIVGLIAPIQHLTDKKSFSNALDSFPSDVESTHGTPALTQTEQKLSIFAFHQKNSKSQTVKELNQILMNQLNSSKNSFNLYFLSFLDPRPPNILYFYFTHNFAVAQTLFSEFGFIQSKPNSCTKLSTFSAMKPQKLVFSGHSVQADLISPLWPLFYSSHYPISCLKINKIYPVAIIGAGPAGLYASWVFEQNKIPHCIIEDGKYFPREDIDLGGIGGCGLNSDGKWSFKPSAELLWKHYPTQKSFSMLETHFSHFGFTPQPTSVAPDGCFSFQKWYSSFYMDYSSRKELIYSLEPNIYGKILYQTNVVSIDLSTSENQDSKKYFQISFDKSLSLRFNQKKQSLKNTLCNTFGQSDTLIQSSLPKINAYRCILATGRLGIPKIHPSCPKSFQRYEFGVRLEYPYTNPFFNNPATDIKIKFSFQHNKKTFSGRTFCSCRRGKVVRFQTQYGNLCSGRADLSIPTQFSNFALLVRVPPDLIKSVDLSVIDSLAIDSGGILKSAFDYLVNLFPYLKSPTHIYGPCFEGIGEYPIHSKSDFSMNHNKLYVIGDASGIYRGLTAAAISGISCGLEIIKSLPIAKSTT